MARREDPEAGQAGDDPEADQVGGPEDGGPEAVREADQVVVREADQEVGRRQRAGQVVGRRQVGSACRHPLPG